MIAPTQPQRNGVTYGDITKFPTILRQDSAPPVLQVVNDSPRAKKQVKTPRATRYRKFNSFPVLLFQQKNVDQTIIDLFMKGPKSLLKKLRAKMIHLGGKQYEDLLVLDQDSAAESIWLQFKSTLPLIIKTIDLSMKVFHSNVGDRLAYARVIWKKTDLAKIDVSDQTKPTFI